MLEKIIQDKAIKPKEKVAIIGEWLLDGSLSLERLLQYATIQKGPVKATCIEAAEYATARNPAIAEKSLFDFVTLSEE